MTATAMKESMSLVLGTGPDAQLPDLSKPTNLVKFAALFSGDQLAKLSGEQQAVFLTTLGNHLGVRAELGEIMLYQGKPYITIDGRIRVAHNSGLLNGIDPQPASSMDRARYQVKEGEHLWKCYVLKKGALKPFVGWGHVRLNDRNPVSKSHPQEMAKKRAKYDALRLAFPPNEDITPLHQHYIQEAEDEARTRTVGSLARVSDYYDDAPDDRSVLGEEVASGGSAAADSASQSAKGVSGLSPTESATPAAAAATDTPALVEDEERAEMPDPASMTLEQAKALKLFGGDGAWGGQAGKLLENFSTGHLEQIKKWCVARIEASGDDPVKQLTIVAIDLIVADRAQQQQPAAAR
jgi:hypothetical protein